MDTKEIENIVVSSLEDVKGQDIVVIDVRGKTTFTDVMVIASGTSDRHVKALAENVVVNAKKADIMPVGVESDAHNEWILVDLCDVIVHVMLPRTRDYYNLEKLWLTDKPVEKLQAISEKLHSVG